MTTDAGAARLIDPEVFTANSAPGDINLRGGRCTGCGTVGFPTQDGCARCGQDQIETIALPHRGVLWSFTVQAFPPKTPFRYSGEFEPFGVGYVHLGDVVVESRLTVNDPGLLRIGQEMELVEITNHLDDDGTAVRTYAFAPVGQQPAAAATTTSKEGQL